MREASFTRPLTVALPEEVFRQIKEITDEKRISMAQWVRAVAEKALAEEKNNENSKGEK
ncbi:MAG: hypothetical protein WCJ37_13855 [Syntrophus sp. (in: bacteria)]